MGHFIHTGSSIITWVVSTFINVHLNRKEALAKRGTLPGISKTTVVLWPTVVWESDCYSAFSLHRTSGPARTGRSRRTSDPSEMEWNGLVQSTSDALLDVRPFVSQRQNEYDVWIINQSNGLPRSTWQRALISGLILGSLEREICLISQQYSLD